MVREKQEPFFNRRSRGTKLPITQDEYRRIREIIRKEGGRFVARNLLLVNLQTNTCVSSADVLRFKTGTVYRERRIINKYWINQKKTSRSQLVSATAAIRADVEAAIKAYGKMLDPYYFENPKNPLFPSSRIDKQTGTYKPLSYSAYHRVLKQAFSKLDMDPKLYGTHSLRTAIPLAYYNKTGDTAGAKAIFDRKSGQTTITYIETVSSLKAIEIKKELLFTD